MVVHGKGGWELVEYDWNEDTGEGRCTYERTRTDTGEIETAIVQRLQPSLPKHVGWK